MIVVTFALPQESQDFRKALLNPKGFTGRMPVPLHQGSRPSPAREDGGLIGCLSNARESADIRVLHTGVGLAAAEHAMGKLLVVERPHVVISSGFAGALDPKLRVADLVVATNFSSPELAGVCREIGVSPSLLHFGGISSQTAAIESVSEKAALGRTSGALAVDMETSAIAATCQATGVPFLSVRAISDSAHERLPVPFDVWFDLKKQRPRALNLVCHLAAHPGTIGPFIRFVRGLTPARLALTGFLIDLLNSETFAARLKQIRSLK